MEKKYYDSESMIRLVMNFQTSVNCSKFRSSARDRGPIPKQEKETVSKFLFLTE